MQRRIICRCGCQTINMTKRRKHIANIKSKRHCINSKTKKKIPYGEEDELSDNEYNLKY